MSFPFITGLSDQPTSTINGLIISVPMSQVPNTPNWIQGDCASYVHVDNYDMNMVCNTENPFKLNSPPPQFFNWSQKDDILSTPDYLPTAFMVVYDPDNVIDAVSNFENMIANYDGRVSKSYAYYTQPAIINYGSAYSKQAYPVLESEGREHYIGLVSITARNLAGTATWTGYYNNYPAQASTYPYIISAEINYYYKPNLAGSSVSVCPLSFVAQPKDVTLFAGANATGNMYFQWYYTGKLAQFLGRTLLRAPALAYDIYTPLIGYSYYATALLTADGFPFAHMKVYPGDVPNSRAPFCYFEYSDVEKAANCRGLPWVGGSTGLRDWHGADTTSDSCHLPIVNADGSTTPNGYTGVAIGAHYNDPNTTPPTSSLVNTTNVNPNPVVDETPEYPTLIPGYDEDLQAAAPTFTGVGCFGTYYALNRIKVNNLNDFLWTRDDSQWDELIKSLAFWGNNPADSVMSFKVYPFDIAIATNSSNFEPIMFGKLNTSIYAIRLNDNSTCILDLGETWINRSNLGLPNDFKAFSPYTIATLYIPYIGAVEFDINYFMDAVMKIQMVVDITTGTCTAIVYNNGMPYLYIPGTIGVDIPITQQSVTSIASSLMETAMVSALHGTAGLMEIGVGAIIKANSEPSLNSKGKPTKVQPGDSEIESGGAKISGAASSALSGAGDVLSKVFVNATDISSRGSNSPGASMALSQYCYIIISQQEPIYPRNYGHTCGYPCHVSDRLENFTGFTICQNVDTSGILCTEIERNMIKNLLESGVYL